MKACTKCGFTGPLINFYKKKGGNQGVTGRCKGCIKESAIKWRKENSEVVRQKDKDRSTNRRIERPEKEKEYQRNYYIKNRGVKLSRNRVSRVNRSFCVPPWLSYSQREEINQFYWLAKDLQAVTGEPYHVDHIVPLQGENVCGLHVPWNLQVLPRDVNIRKANKLEV